MPPLEPAFVIAGGQRCGTTTLYHLLDGHPAIHMAKPPRPEPKFFVRDPAAGRDREWYLATWFSDCGGAAVAGEKSTSYLETPGVPERIRALFPEMKVVVLLRHPVERAVSNYLFSRRNGLETEAFAHAVRTEEARVTEPFPGVSVHPFAYLRRGRYAEQLERFLAVFPRERLHVALLDELLADPGRVLADVFAFLGVDPAAVPHAELPHENARPGDDLTLDRETLAYLFDHYAGPNRRLAAFLGRDLPHWNRPTPALTARLA